MVFHTTDRLVLLLAILLVPCVITKLANGHSDAELGNHIPYFDDVVAYFMEPTSNEYGEMDEGILIFNSYKTSPRYL